MNPPKCDELDYIQFLVAAQKVFTCTEAARSQPETTSPKPPPAHDAFTRLLTRKLPDTEALWAEARRLVKPKSGLLVHDDTTLETSPTRRRWSWYIVIGAASIGEWSPGST
jgi:putative transposase